MIRAAAIGTGRKSTHYWQTYWDNQWEAQTELPRNNINRTELNRYDLSLEQQKFRLAPITCSIAQMPNAGRDLPNSKGKGFLVGVSKEQGLKGAETHSPVDKWWMTKITRGHINIIH
jgi:hypothetical protein